MADSSVTVAHFNKRQIGYFTSPYPEARPAFDPDFPTACPYCGAEVDETNVRTSSVAWLEDREVSAFIRCHRACNDADTVNELDGKVLDTIGQMVKNGELYTLLPPIPIILRIPLRTRSRTDLGRPWIA